MAESGEDHAIKFGQLVRERRKALGWSQEALAAEAFSNSDRKGYVSQIENGKVPDITGETVKKIANALKIDVEHIPHRLRWREAVAEIAHTSEIAQSIHAQQKIDSAKIDATAAMVAQLVAESQSLAKEFGLKEGLLIGVARKYAEGNPDNFDAALKGIESALEAARDMQERGRLPSNLSAAVDAVIAQVMALNNADRLDEATKAIDDALAALDEEDARRRAERARLYDIGIDQARLTNSPAEASRFAIAKFDLDAPDGFEERYQALRSIFIEWYQRGYEKGLNFDLEVAIELAREAVQRAATLDQRGAMRTNLGIALSSLGTRESGTARLEAAVAAYHEALKELTRERVPLDWAMTQNNLGNALQSLGTRESGTVRLEAAVAAYEEALKEQTRERVPLQWAGTQMNLGFALFRLGERESGTARLEAAVAAFHEALKEWTRERVPLDWAATLGNRAATQLVIAERTKDLTLARAALADLELAAHVTRDGGHVPNAEYYESQIVKAREVVARLEAG